MSVKKVTGLPELPKAGVSGDEDFNHLRKVKVPVAPEEYAFGNSNVRRNIYGVPVE
jgi:hypothetical protein